MMALVNFDPQERGRVSARSTARTQTGASSRRLSILLERATEGTIRWTLRRSRLPPQVVHNHALKPQRGRSPWSA